MKKTACMSFSFIILTLSVRNCSVPSQWLLNSYEKTIKLGQTDKDGTLYDVTTITLYDGSYMGIKIYGLDDLDMLFAVR